MMLPLLLAFAPTLVAAGSTCSSIKQAYKSSNCCNSDLAKTTAFSVTSTAPQAPQYISYKYKTGMNIKWGIQAYTKIKSATCGYADLVGAVFSDPTILTQVPQFYSFLSSGYVTDITMEGRDAIEACEAHCTGDCKMWYYQYEWTNSSSMVAAGAPARWMHKCQLTGYFNGSDCGSPFAADANAKDEYTGRVSAAGGYVYHSVKYNYTTDVAMSAGTSIQTYTKIKSATCGYADLTGAVFSDPTILTQVPQFYSFLSSGYVTDTEMVGPEACQAYCNAMTACQMFYYQYEWTNSSSMVAVGAPARWMHKCQLLLPYSGSNCGSPFEADANDKDEYAGRVSAAGSK